MRKNYDFSEARRGLVVQQPGRTRVRVHLDNDLLQAVRERGDAEGRGYQAMINEALRKYLGRSTEPVDAWSWQACTHGSLSRVGTAPSRSGMSAG
jgi:hypothetical protein